MADEDNKPKPMFYLTPKEILKGHNWQKAHDAEKHIPPGKTYRYSGAIGGAYTWCFTPTSIGTIASIRCSCGEKLDITDYDEW